MTQSSHRIANTSGPGTKPPLRCTAVLGCLAVVAAFLAAPASGLVEETFAPTGRGVLIRRDPAVSGRGTVVALGEAAGAATAARVGDVVSVWSAPCDGTPVSWGAEPAGTYCQVPARYVFGAVTTDRSGRSSPFQADPSAQQPKLVSLRGRVVDALTGLPILTATVTITDSSGQVVAGPLAVDPVTGFFGAAVLGAEGVDLAVSASAAGYLAVTASPFPSLGPKAPVLNDFLTNGGLDVALLNASTIPEAALLTTVLWKRGGVVPTFFVDGAWEVLPVAVPPPGQGETVMLENTTRGIERLYGGPFHETIANRTNVSGTIRFVLDLFWNYNGDATYAPSHVQVFFFTRAGLQLAVRGPFDETSLLGAQEANRYPFWHVAEYSSATDTVTPVLPARLRLDPSAAEIIATDLMAFAPEWFQ